MSAYRRQEAVCLQRANGGLPQQVGNYYCREIPGRGQVTQGNSLSDWPPIADLVLHWSDLKHGLAVLHYQHPLQNHMINDVLFPHFCFWGHHKRTSHSTGMLGQKSPVPTFPPLLWVRFSPVHDWSQEWQDSSRSWGEEGWAIGLKWMEKLKEWEFLFLQCAPLLTIISKLPEWKRIRKQQRD